MPIFTIVRVLSEPVLAVRDHEILNNRHPPSILRMLNRHSGWCLLEYWIALTRAL